MQGSEDAADLDLGAVRAYWDGQADGFDAETDHGLRDPAVRVAWRELVLGALPPPPAEIADLACGTGTLAELAAEAGHRVWAVDLSDRMVGLARAKTARFADRVRVEQGDASTPALRDQGVDAVLARHIVWALPDPRAALRRWVALVRPGGRLVLVEGVWGSEAADVGSKPTVPWRAGAPSDELAAYLRGLPHVADVTVRRLPEPIYWGREIDHERYLLVARVSGTSISGE